MTESSLANHERFQENVLGTQSTNNERYAGRANVLVTFLKGHELRINLRDGYKPLSPGFYQAPNWCHAQHNHERETMAPFNIDYRY
jgi:hypothetical protein